MRYSLWYILFLQLVKTTHSCTQDECLLRKNNVVPNTKILCSQKVEVMKDIAGFIEALSRKDVIAIYKLNSTAAHICYWKEVENNLVALSSLSGGTIYAKGK